MFDEDFLAEYDIEEEEVVTEPEGTRANHSYGPLKRKKYYNIIDEGYDWVAVKLQGLKVYVPEWVFG